MPIPPKMLRSSPQKSKVEVSPGLHVFNYKLKGVAGEIDLQPSNEVTKTSLLTLF